MSIQSYLLIQTIDRSALLNFHKDVVQKIQSHSSRSVQVTRYNNSAIPRWKSDKCGYVALVYSGTARSFSANFESHIVNLMAGSPYTVYLFFHTYINDNRFPNHVNYLSINATLAYFEGYINLDNERVLFHDAVKANVYEYMPLASLQQIYNDTFDISQKRFPGHPPISGIYYMWHSPRRAEELRQNYMIHTGIDYKWTFRMRHDAVYFTNWWQQAFNIKVYNHSNSIHKTIKHDISGDWGIRPTRLYDMIYEPKLTMNHVLYVPFGWSYGGYNDQFAAMSSHNANHYFTRILHVDRMLREEKVHPETSIRLIARWNNITVNNRDGIICYDIVRVPSHMKQHANNNLSKHRSCSYKNSGRQDCNILCPKIEKTNKVLRDSFIHNGFALFENVTQIKSLLINHISRINNRQIQIQQNSSSFYYFHRYIIETYMNRPCLPNTWTKDQSNNYVIQHLPFVLRTTNRTKLNIYNKYLTCGLPVRL